MVWAWIGSLCHLCARRESRLHATAVAKGAGEHQFARSSITRTHEHTHTRHPGLPWSRRLRPPTPASHLRFFFLLITFIVDADAVEVGAERNL